MNKSVFKRCILPCVNAVKRIMAFIKDISAKTVAVVSAFMMLLSSGAFTFLTEFVSRPSFTANAVEPVNVPGVITNYPTLFPNGEGTVSSIVTTNIGNMQWTPPTYGFKGYDTAGSSGSNAIAFNKAKSKQYNGYESNEHMHFAGDILRFFGYGHFGRMDMAYTDYYQYGMDSIEFVIEPYYLSPHTMAESGVLFNGEFDSTGKKYTGYMLLFQRTENEEVLGETTIALRLIYCENELMDPKRPSDYKGTIGKTTAGGTRKKQITIRANILDWSTSAIDPMDGQNKVGLSGPPLLVRVQNVGRGFEVYLDGELVHEETMAGINRYGFGFFTGYFDHNCTWLTVMQYSHIAITTRQLAIKTQPTVKFVDIDTGQQIAFTQTEPTNAEKCFAFDSYKISPPQTIGGYVFVKSSRPTLDPIMYREDPAENITTLYYKMDVQVAKSASVNGVYGLGEPDYPVKVDKNGEIKYEIDSFSPFDDLSLPEAKEVANVRFERMFSGIDSVFAISRDKDVYVWGLNTSGQLGLGHILNQTTPLRNATLSDINKNYGIDTIYGMGHSFFLRTNNGDYYTWGLNTSGQLGNGAVTNVTKPTIRPEFRQGGTYDFVDLWVGYDFVHAKTRDGVYYSWGTNANRAMGVGSAQIYSTPLLNTNIQNIANKEGVSQIVTEYRTTVLVTDPLPDGYRNFYNWGYNNYGQLGRGNTTNINVPTLHNAGTNNLQTLERASYGPIVKLEVHGTLNYFAQTADGRWWACGYNARGILGRGNLTSPANVFTVLTNVNNTALYDFEEFRSGGGGITVYNKLNNRWWVWGSNYGGALGIGTGDATDANHRSTPLDNAVLNNFLATQGSRNDWEILHNLFYTKILFNKVTGKVYACGRNNSGQCGQGNTAVKNSFTEIKKFFGVAGPVVEFAKFEKFWTGYDSGIGLQPNGDVWVWGANANGQLGLGGQGINTTAQTKPVKNERLSEISRDEGVDEIFSCSYSYIMRTESGNYYVWGRNNWGQLALGENVTSNTSTTPPANVPTPTLNPKLSDLSQYLSIAAFNTIYNNSASQIYGDDLTGVSIVDIWGSGDYFIARDSMGHWYCWGTNAQLQFGTAAPFALAATQMRTYPYPNSYIYDQLIATDKGVSDVYCTNTSVMIVTASEPVEYHTWGGNNYGQLGRNIAVATTTGAPALSTQITAVHAISPITDVYLNNNGFIVRVANGDFYGWGIGTSGQFGDGTVANRIAPAKLPIISPGGTNEIVEIMQNAGAKRGFATYYALGKDGNWRSWGFNTSGQLGIGSITNKTTAETTPALDAFFKSLGNFELYQLYSATMIRDFDTGKVYVAGSNATGIIALAGEFDTAAAANPTSKFVENSFLSGGVDVDKIWKNGYATIARSTSDEIYVWGRNNYSQLGLGTGDVTHRSLPWINKALTKISLEEGIEDIWSLADGWFLRTLEGKVYYWGYNVYGQLGDGTTNTVVAPKRHEFLESINFTGLWMNESTCFARGDDDTVYFWGRNQYTYTWTTGAGTTADPTVTHTATLYASGLPSAAASAGTGGIGNTVNQLTPMKHVGLNGKGGVAEMYPMYGGAFIAKANDGLWYCWGSNRYGEAGSGATIVGNSTTAHIREMTSNGYLNALEKNVSPIVEWLAPRGGSSSWGNTNYCIVRLENGDIYSWGIGANGQQGKAATGTTEPNYYTGTGFFANVAATGNSNFPRKNVNLTNLNIQKAWCGYSNSFVLGGDGRYYVWGTNTNGKCGLNVDAATVAQYNSPTANTYLDGLGVVSLWDNYHSWHALTEAQEYYAWGRNDFGTLSDATLVERVPQTKVSPQLKGAVHDFRVRDVLPAGLSLAPVDGKWYITDENGNPVDLGNLKVTADKGVDGRDRITFDFTKMPKGLTRFFFTATVNSPEGYFDNHGQFYNGFTTSYILTNKTYHASGIYNVTEKYRSFYEPSKVLKPNTERPVGKGLPDENYSPYNSVMTNITDGDGTVWRYYAYQRVGIDAEPIPGTPPNGLDFNHSGTDEQFWWCIPYYLNGGYVRQQDEEIIFYFIKDTNILIEYKDVNDRNGDDLKPDYTTTASSILSYNMPATHMNAFNGWTYAGYYSLDVGETWETGTPPVPTFKADEMGTDKHIILCFTKDPAVIIQYREYREDVIGRQSGLLLFNSGGFNRETFVVPFGGAFDAVSHATVSDSVLNGVKSSVSKEYPFYMGWSDDKGVTFHTGVPPVFNNVEANKEIILYFKTANILTEYFYEYQAVPSGPPNVLSPEIVSLVYGGDTFTGSPPLSIYDGLNRWEYVGYRIGSNSDIATLRTDTDPPYTNPVIQNISGDEKIFYQYVKREVSTRLTVIERFREKDNTGNILKNNVETVANAGDPFPGNYPSEITKYIYWGYQIDDGEAIFGAFPGIDSLKKVCTITYLYEIAPVVVHIRQIVVSAPDGLDVPYGEGESFFRLTDSMNDSTHIVGWSGLESYGFTPFVTRELGISGNGIFSVIDIIPQYYSYFGYFLNSGSAYDSKHDDSNYATKSLDIKLNYNNSNEYWLTVFIIAKDSPERYDWGHVTNVVGEILPKK